MTVYLLTRQDRRQLFLSGFVAGLLAALTAGALLAHAWFTDFNASTIALHQDVAAIVKVFEETERQTAAITQMQQKETANEKDKYKN